MRYWEDMRSKYGFNYGQEIPPDAEKCREVYVKVVNALAEKLGSKIRVEEYNRPGFHNYCLILFVRLGENSTVENEPKPDDELKEAIDRAFELDLDGLFSTEVRIKENDLEEVLQSIENKGE